MRGFTKRTLSTVLSFLMILPCVTSAPVAASANEPIQYIFGDVNLDGEITLKDASAVQRGSLGMEILSAEQLALGDVDGNRTCTLSDAYIIQKYALGSSMEYPVTSNGYSVGNAIYIHPGSDSDTNIVSDSTDTESTDTIFDLTDTDSTDTMSDSTDTDSGEPVDVLSMEEILYNLNGNFEREDVFPDNWTPPTDRANIYAEQKTGINGSASLKIVNNNSSVSRIKNELYGLEPNGEYKLTAKVKGSSIEAEEHRNGAFVDVGSILGGNYYLGYLEDGTTMNFGRGYMIDTNNNWQNGTFDWTEITCYFIADHSGRADIVCALQGKGTAWFDDLTIEKINYDSEPTDKVKLEGEHTGVIMYKDDISDLDENELRAWVSELDNAYELMAELMGGVPFGGDKCYFLSSEEPYVTQYQALGAINPIKWAREYMSAACRARCTENMKTRVAYHEMGHNFDKMYPWAFNGEATADYKATYVILHHAEGLIDPRGARKKYPIDEYMDFIKSESSICYEKTIAARDGQYTLDALNYILIRTSESVGWDVTQAAFKKFSEYYDTSYSTSFGKFMYMLMNLQNTYNDMHPGSMGSQVYDSFPEGELEYIKNLILENSSSAYKAEQDIFAVRFKDLDGSDLGFAFVPYGESVYPPVAKGSDKYGAFIGWSSDLTSITADMVVTPIYENFSASASISVKNEQTYSNGIQAAQGNFVTANVTDSFGNGTQYRIVCKTAGTLVYDSGYTLNPTQRFMLRKSGDTNIFAYVRSSDGTQIMTNVCSIDTAAAVTVYYAGYDTPYIHYRVGTGEWTAVPGEAMTKTDDFTGYTHKYTVILDKSTSIKACFNNGNNTWDNNGGSDYTIKSGIYGIKNGTVKELT